jgi:hypothetical protein
MEPRVVEQAHALLFEIARRAQTVVELIDDEHERERLHIGAVLEMVNDALAQLVALDTRLRAPHDDRMAELDDSALGCSFCAKPQGEVGKLIGGPAVYICDQCITLCCDILELEPSDPARHAANDEDVEQGPPSSVRRTDAPPKG